MTQAVSDILVWACLVHETLLAIKQTISIPAADTTLDMTLSLGLGRLVDVTTFSKLVTDLTFTLAISKKLKETLPMAK